jgi:hypothetical protein
LHFLHLLRKESRYNFDIAERVGVTGFGYGLLAVFVEVLGKTAKQVAGKGVAGALGPSPWIAALSGLELVLLEVVASLGLLWQ